VGIISSLACTRRAGKNCDRNAGRVYDEETRSECIHTFVRALPRDEFPDFARSRQFVALVLAITARKVLIASGTISSSRATCGGIFGLYFVESATDAAYAGLVLLPLAKPTPEFAAEFVETCETLFLSLEDPDLQQW